MNNSIGHEAIVSGCSDCPLRAYYNGGKLWCNHPKKENGGWIERDKFGSLTPSDCPLLTEPLTIQMYNHD